MGSSEMNRHFDVTQPLAPPRTPFKKAKRDSTRPPTPHDFTVPLQWSIWIGFIAGVFVEGVYLLTCKLVWWSFDIGWAALLFLMTAAGVCLMESNWFKQQLWVGGKVLQVAERIVGWDINQDGQIGPPPQITAYELHRSPSQTIRGDLPGPPHVIREWAVAALNRQSLAYAAWDKRWGFDTYDGRRESVYREFRRDLVRYGLGIENGTHGIDLTRRGAELFESLVNAEPKDAVPMIDAPQPAQLVE